MRRLLVLIALCGAPAWATTDAWPALYDVVGVASDDVLNIRAEPSSGSEIIGTLSHDAEGIEVIRPDEGFEWGLVNVGERTGWISLTYAVPQPGQWYGQIPAVAAACQQCHERGQGQGHRRGLGGGKAQAQAPERDE